MTISVIEHHHDNKPFILPQLSMGKIMVKDGHLPVFTCLTYLSSRAMYLTV